MNSQKTINFNSPLGKQVNDSSGSPIGVVRMDVKKSYKGIDNLLQKYINDSDQESWNKIKEKIDYTLNSLDYALTPLEKDTSFFVQIKEKLEKGQKLLFKPNLVSPICIDPQTHGYSQGRDTCTDWAFIAALMRWFHDKGEISYYQMALGEAATVFKTSASICSKINPDGREITTEAIIEGKSGYFIGGWGFYFVRQYLSESLKEGESDDPFRGYEESINGTYIPPGLVSDKLMVYDLNRIYDDPNKGRKCKVPDGVNYKSIVLHKVITGGYSDDSEDMKAYPGCILINVPKFKVHAIALFTNIIKNLGIGLYPMHYASEGDKKWDYARPQGTTVVGMKAGIPHQIWIPEVEHDSSLPKRDTEGNFILKKTGGIIATMIDIIKAVDNLDIMMLHIVDGIEAINVDHQGISGVRTAEGMVFGGLDPVATDLLCARYMFSNVSLKESLEVNLEGGTAGGFPQKVPIPTINGQDIISKEGYDSPLARDITFESAQKRGLGQMDYHVMGYDLLTDSPIISLKGHLGTIKNERFSDLITKTLFYDMFKVPWDLQRTAINYLAVIDKLEGTKLREEFFEKFDEDNDGIVSYEEFGKNGATSVVLHAFADYVSLMGREKLGYLEAAFKLLSFSYRYSNKQNNSGNYEFMKEHNLNFVCYIALAISQLDMEFPDIFIPGRMYGKGKWPSLQLTRYVHTGSAIYGTMFPLSITYPCLYSNALFYADLTQNDGKYAGELRSHPNPRAISKYISDVRRNKIKPLDFILYVPAEFNIVSGKIIPNVEITDDPMKIFTVSFQNGKEIWS
ncbi:MAG: DUF362 domain-containing protein [Promethearchaeota archaeon]